MGLFSNKNNGSGTAVNVDVQKDKDIRRTRVSAVSSRDQTLYQSTRISKDILTELTQATDKFKAIDTIVNKTPDGKTALNVYVTFTNRGGEYKFYHPKTGKRNKKPDADFRKWRERIGYNNGSGLDGIMDVLARSAYTRGGIAFEVIVSDDMKTINDIAVVDPASFQSFEWIESEGRYAIYQKREDAKKVDLYSGNFVYFPYQPNVGSPVGTLKFEPAISAMTTYYQHIIDSTVVLNRIGYPKYDVAINAQAILDSASASEKATFDDRMNLMNSAFDDTAGNMASIGRDSDIIHFDHTEIKTIGGSAGSGIDVRAWLDVDVPLVCNSFCLQPIMMGRQKEGSYALGSATFKAFVDGVESTSKDLKRANEYIANIWARLNGYNVVCEFEPTPLDWMKEVDRWEARLKEQEFFRRSEEYGYIDKDRAAIRLHNVEKATGTTKPDMFEFLEHQYETATTVEEVVVEEPKTELEPKEDDE